MKPSLFMRKERDAVDAFAAFVNVGSMQATESNFAVLRKALDKAEKKVVKEIRMKKMKGVNVGRHPYFQKRGSYDGEKMVVALRMSFTKEGMGHYDEIVKLLKRFGFKERSMSQVGSTLNNHGRIEEWKYPRSTTHFFMSDIVKGEVENMEEVAKNQKLMASRVAANTCRNIILTGPPSAGKTTMMNRFKGIAKLVDEVARDVHKEWNAGNKWGKGKNFQAEVWDRSLDAVERELGTDDDLVMFDRTHLDCLAYGYIPDEAPKPIKDAEVWLMKLRPERYKNDAERKETYEEAAALGERLKRVYRDLGYSVREIYVDDPSTWPDWARKRLERRRTSSSGGTLMEGVEENIQELVDNQALMASRVASHFVMSNRISSNLVDEDGLKVS